MGLFDKLFSKMINQIENREMLQDEISNPGM